ncbi:MAG: ABC transporter substrate-binding protein [Candidatus Freyarchaeota archaeon]
MAVRKVLLSLVLALMITLTIALIPTVASPEEKRGPRTDNLLIHIFYDPTTENWALDKGEIDINDWPLSKEWVDRWVGRPEEITMRSFAEIGMMEIDINNQRWPTGCPEHMEYDPATDTEKSYYDPTCEWCEKARMFRIAIAHLLPRERIISEVLKGYGYRMDTPVPVPALAGFTDYAGLEAEGLIYDYDPAKAVEILDAAGFVDTDGDGIRNDPKTGANLEPLIFYIRMDDPNRRAAGEMLRDELRKVGIPVEDHVTERTVCYKKVMVEYDYHLYTGGWSLSRDIDFVHDLWHSSGYWAPTGWSLNYPGFCNKEFDELARKIKYGVTIEEAKEAAIEAQKVFAKMCPIIPMWCSAGVKAYRTGWKGVVNMEGFGIDITGGANPFTFILMEQPGKDTIHYGFKSDLEMIHPVCSEWLWDWNVIPMVYESLLQADPYDLSRDLPWLAKSWEVGTWEVEPGKLGSKVTFHLRDDVVWHDGTPFTSADVKFTIDFTKACGPGVAWNYPMVMDVNRTETPDDYTVEVYFNVVSCWALHWSGGLPILPKHIWEKITDAEGRTWTDPDWDPMCVREYHPWEVGELIGTGPWKFVSWTKGESVLLTANREWYMTADEVEEIVTDSFHRVGDVNYSGVIDVTDLSMMARALGTDSTMTPGTGWDEWNEACDLNGDGKVDIKDLYLAGKNYGKVSG